MAYRRHCKNLHSLKPSLSFLLHYCHRPTLDCEWLLSTLFDASLFTFEPPATAALFLFANAVVFLLILMTPLTIGCKPALLTTVQFLSSQLFPVDNGIKTSF